MRAIFHPHPGIKLHKSTFSELQAAHPTEFEYALNHTAVLDDIDTPSLLIKVDGNIAWLATPAGTGRLLISSGNCQNLCYVKSGFWFFHRDYRKTCLRLRKLDGAFRDGQIVSIVSDSRYFVLQVVATPEQSTVPLLSYINHENDSIIVSADIFQARAFHTKADALYWWRPFEEKYPNLQVAVVRAKMGV